MKYPDQIVAIIRNKNLIVDAKLSLPQNEEEDPPLEMYSVFSRFLFTIKSTLNNKNVFTKANVIIEDVADIVKRTDYAVNMICRAETGAIVKTGDCSDSPAFTVKLFDKNYKGQTPAEVLIKDSSAKGALLKIKDWLNANLANYPNNENQIKAIDDAIKLLEEGKLNQQNNASQSGIFKVYETENKYFTSEKEKKDGNYKIYNISVVCEPGKNYPFTVRIMNCYAPLDFRPDGTTQIKMSAAVEKVDNYISLTEKEWVNIVKRMQKTMDNFEAVYAPKQFEIHKKHEWRPDTVKTQ